MESAAQGVIENRLAVCNDKLIELIKDKILRGCVAVGIVRQALDPVELVDGDRSAIFSSAVMMGIVFERKLPIPKNYTSRSIS